MTINNLSVNKIIFYFINIVMIIPKKLNDIYFQITNENINWEKINKHKYYKEFKCLLKKNPIFKELLKKYSLQEIGLNKKIIYNKFLYIYIFLEFVYKKCYKNPHLFQKVFDINKNNKYSDNFFVNLKRETLNICFKSSYLFNLLLDKNNMVFENFKFNLGIDINIMEAVITDIFNGYYDNAYLGLKLITSLPFSSNTLKDNNTIIDKNWMDLYTSWNANFIYTGGPGKECFPGGNICLMNAQKYNKINKWGNNRLYTLYLTTVLEIFNEFKHEKVINKDFLDTWNKLNMKNISKLK